MSRPASSMNIDIPLTAPISMELAGSHVTTTNAPGVLSLESPHTPITHGSLMFHNSLMDEDQQSDCSSVSLDALRHALSQLSRKAADARDPYIKADIIAKIQQCLELLEQ